MGNRKLELVASTWCLLLLLNGTAYQGVFHTPCNLFREYNRFHMKNVSPLYLISSGKYSLQTTRK